MPGVSRHQGTNRKVRLRKAVPVPPNKIKPDQEARTSCSFLEPKKTSVASTTRALPRIKNTHSHQGKGGLLNKSHPPARPIKVPRIKFRNAALLN